MLSERWYWCESLEKIPHYYTYSIDRRRSVCIITHMNSKDIVKKLEQDGWKLVATKGSHHQFKHPTKPGRVTVPHPKKDMKIGTVKSIMKQAGL